MQNMMVREAMLQASAAGFASSLRAFTKEPPLIDMARAASGFKAVSVACCAAGPTDGSAIADQSAFYCMEIPAAHRL